MLARSESKTTVRKTGLVGGLESRIMSICLRVYVQGGLYRSCGNGR